MAYWGVEIYSPFSIKRILDLYRVLVVYSSIENGVFII